MQILVVDDEVVSRKKIKRIMESFGRCESAETGAEAIANFKKSLDFGVPFDLILLDVTMPEMDGVEVLRKIRDLEHEYGLAKNLRSKVLMVTSHSEKETIIYCLKAGCNDFLVKPIARETIEEKLTKIGCL